MLLFQLFPDSFEISALCGKNANNCVCLKEDYPAPTSVHQIFCYIFHLWKWKLLFFCRFDWTLSPCIFEIKHSSISAPATSAFNLVMTRWQDMSKWCFDGQFPLLTAEVSVRGPLGLSLEKALLLFVVHISRKLLQSFAHVDGSGLQIHKKHHGNEPWQQPKSRNIWFDHSFTSAKSWHRNMDLGG